MKNRKLFSFVIMMALLIVAYPGLAFSKTTTIQPHIIFQANEITNPDILHQRAIDGVSDFKGKMNHRASVTDQKTNTIKDLTVKSTTQLLEISKNYEGVTKKKYATTTFARVNTSDLLNATTAAIISCDVFDNSAVLGSRAIASSASDSGYDSSYGVEAYNTFYWTNSVDGNGLEYYDLDSGSGGWNILDSQLTISNKYYQFIQIGWAYGQAYREYKSTWASCGTTFSGTAPSSWSPINKDTSIGFGLSQKCLVTRSGSGSSWNFQFNNDIGGGI